MAKSRTILEVLLSLIWVIIPVIAIIVAQMNKKKKSQEVNLGELFNSTDNNSENNFVDDDGLVNLEYLMGNAGKVEQQKPVVVAEDKDIEYEAPADAEVMDIPAPAVSIKPEKADSYAEFICDNKQNAFVIKEILSKPKALRDV